MTFPGALVTGLGVVTLGSPPEHLTNETPPYIAHVRLNISVPSELQGWRGRHVLHHRQLQVSPWWGESITTMSLDDACSTFAFLPT